MLELFSKKTKIEENPVQFKGQKKSISLSKCSFLMFVLARDTSFNSSKNLDKLPFCFGELASTMLSACDFGLVVGKDSTMMTGRSSGDLC